MRPLQGISQRVRIGRKGDEETPLKVGGGQEGRTLITVAKTPRDCTEDERSEFERLLRQGEEVITNKLQERIKRAACLVFLRDDTDKLIGVGALKNPKPKYATKQFRLAKSSERIDDYPYELGWIYIDPAHRGRGLSFAIASKALESANGKGVFATARVGNNAMRKTNNKLGFKCAGNPYGTARNNRSYDLTLFVRPDGGSSPRDGNAIQQTG